VFKKIKATFLKIQYYGLDIKHKMFMFQLNIGSLCLTNIFFFVNYTGFVFKSKQFFSVLPTSFQPERFKSFTQMYEESTYIGKLRQIKIQIFWTGNTAFLTVWCFLITDWMRTVYFELHTSCFRQNRRCNFTWNFD
jgi:hypothetical protein